jgi:hypothetical protein
MKMKTNLILSNFVLGTVLASTGCGLIDPKSSAESNVYLSVRIVNNELGRLLRSYKTSVVEIAQKQVDTEASRDCQVSDTVCKINVKNRVAQRFSDREVKYNEIVRVQNETKRLLEFADNVCATLTEDLCESAKQDAVKNKRDIEKGWNELSSWLQ